MLQVLLLRGWECVLPPERVLTLPERVVVLVCAAGTPPERVGVCAAAGTPPERVGVCAAQGAYSS